MIELSLENKVAVVTGSGRGLGSSYALALAAAGASVVVNDVDADAAAETVRLIEAAGGRATAVIAPVGGTDTACQLVDAAVTTFGSLDIMVTNAGVLRDRVTWKMSDEDFDAVITTHLRGTFLCGREAIVRMREQGTGGRLILIGSPAGQLGSFGQANYAAAKAGIVAMARTWSLELARDKITANAVVPTAMTAMTATIPMYTQWAQDFAEGKPLPPLARRDHALGGPEDVAPLIVWLASEASSDVTGQALGIGGDRLTLYSHPAELANELHDGGWTPQAIDTAWRSQFAAQAQPSGPTSRPDPASAQEDGHAR
ncbi:SDR family NAD(P)-dependent oxidoreductase [Glutamicibacter creatinolyticus]|uniref:SDR family NAD(P)-dependent oxidoreductase n=1 Tax=Glutamicibacter creatinolyticus TaxID=162496 RepID=UPI0037BFF9B0